MIEIIKNDFKNNFLCKRIQVLHESIFQNSYKFFKLFRRDI